MKSQIHEHQENNFKIVSKTSIIYLGVFALTVFTSCNANNGLKNEFFNQQEVSIITMDNEQDLNRYAFEVSATSLLQNASVIEKDSAVFEAIAAYKNTYVKPIEEVIAEDILITEYIDEEFFPIPLNSKMQAIIAEDSKIIESTSTQDIYPLDFKVINAALNKNTNVEVDIISFDKNALKS